MAVEIMNTDILSQPVLIGAAVLSVAIALAFWLPAWFRTELMNKWVKPLDGELHRAPSLASIEGPENQKARLSEQVQDIVGRAEHHLKVMGYFLSNYYVGILLRNIFSGLGALALFLITKDGWEEADASLVSVFLITSVCAAFFIAFPRMFKQEENVAKNKALYLKYVALLHDVHTFAATGHFPQKMAKGNQSSPDRDGALAAVIEYLNEELKKSNDIAVAFDAGKFAVYKFEPDE